MLNGKNRFLNSANNNIPFWPPFQKRRALNKLMEAAISSKAALAELLGRMEGKGLLKREAGEHDKRRRFIYLTPAGQALFEASRPIADAIDNMYLERVNKDQHESALFVLKTMIGKQ